MPNLQMPEIILLVLVVVLLFGAKKLPDTARGLGRSLRIFKAETKGLRDEDKDESATQTGEPAPQAQPREIGATAPAPPEPAQPASTEQPQAGTTPAAAQPQTPAHDPEGDRR
jgi:sec-independent protein translocase protein TatA